MNGQTEGRIVHYVIGGFEYLGADQAVGQHRPMLILKSWAPGYVDGLVFVNGASDGKHDPGCEVRMAGVGEQPPRPDGTYPPGTWHEVERED